MEYNFVKRSELSPFLWDDTKKQWKRVYIDRETLKGLTKTSTLNGIWRTGLFFLLIIIAAAAAIYISRYNFWLAIPVIYFYYFLYGFLVAIGHELQHKTVFSDKSTWLSEIVFFTVQALMWNSHTYARISHRLHHRYTMVRGFDPETPWPDVVKPKYLRNYLLYLLSKILIVGAVVECFKMAFIQIKRALGIKDKMMKEHCTKNEIAMIQVESASIFLIHAAIIVLSIIYKRWEPLVFITIAFQVGSSMEALWHMTEHLTLPYNVNDQRICTRSLRVTPFVKFLYWGLDDHIEHHMYPAVPSMNLPKLHKILKNDLPKPRTMVQCWKEMFEIAKQKQTQPDYEYVCPEFTLFIK